MKLYVVRKGKVPGIYKTWSECKEQTFKVKGAEFKSFTNREDAVAYFEKRENTSSDTNEVVAYVDGSCTGVREGDKASSGVVILHKGVVIFEEGFICRHNSEYSSTRNVLGELEACISAIITFTALNISRASIYYDYKGIKEFADGSWTPKSKVTQWYKNAFDKVSKDIQIDFHKVAAHSGNKWNDRADELAKQAIGL